MRKSCYDLTGPKDIFCLFIYPSRKLYVSQYLADQLGMCLKYAILTDNNQIFFEKTLFFIKDVNFLSF